MFEKFLKGGATPPAAEEPKKRKAGRPPLPDHLRKYPKRKTERHDAKGRVKRSERKGRPAGSKHYAAKRKVQREYKRRARARGSLAKDLAYCKTLRRKWLQNRNVQRQKAIKRGIEPDVWYTVSYEQWLLMWAEAPDVWYEGALRRPASIVDSPLRTRYKCCYTDRLDKTQGYTPDNVRVFYDRKPLK